MLSILGPSMPISTPGHFTTKNHPQPVPDTENQQTSLPILSLASHTLLPWSQVTLILASKYKVKAVASQQCIWSMMCRARVPKGGQGMALEQLVRSNRGQADPGYELRPPGQATGALGKWCQGDYPWIVHSKLYCSVGHGGSIYSPTPFFSE